MDRLDAPMLFALGATRVLGEEVARRLGVALARHEEREFEDGEHKARALESVRGRDVYVIHTLANDASQGPNDKLVRLLFFLGSLRAAGAGRLTAVVPYLAYARKDQRSKSRDPVATRFVATFFEAVGADRVVTLDVHNLAAFENAYRCETVNLEAAPLLAARVATLLEGAPACVVSPDAGGIKRAEKLRAHLAALAGRPIAAAFVEKHRSEGVLTGGEVVGEVDGHVAVIVDDLIAAGHTLQRASRACLDRGATRVLAAATHGLFVAPAPAVLAASPIERILVTDSVPGDHRLAGEPHLAGRVEVLGTAGLFAAAIARLNAGGSVSELAEVASVSAANEEVRAGPRAPGRSARESASAPAPAARNR